VHKATDARLGRIVRTAYGPCTVVVSGTKIAEEIGIPGRKSGRLIQQLRGFGRGVAGHPATGYQLRAVPDLLLPEMLARCEGHTIFGDAKQIHPPITKSARPIPEAINRRRKGAPEGSVFLARRATGRAWARRARLAFGAVHGSLTVRLILRPSDDAIGPR